MGTNSCSGPNPFPVPNTGHTSGHLSHIPEDRLEFDWFLADWDGGLSNYSRTFDGEGETKYELITRMRKKVPVSVKIIRHGTTGPESYVIATLVMNSTVKLSHLTVSKFTFEPLSNVTTVHTDLMSEFLSKSNGFVIDRHVHIKVIMWKESLKSDTEIDKVNLNLNTILGLEPEAAEIEPQIKYVGIKNQGSTCYMNAFLQSLFHVPEFRRILFSIEVDPTKDSAKNIILNLQRLFGEMVIGTESVSTSALTESFGWDASDNQMQQDIDEFGRLLLDRVLTAVKETKLEKRYESLMCGKIRTRIKCTEVDFESISEEVFTFLPLMVKDFSSLEESFNVFTAPESLTGKNQYQTQEYGLQDAVRTLEFVRFPDILYLHLQRFTYDVKSSSMIKLNTFFSFPHQLDLSKNGESDIFELYGVLVHAGNPVGGHYYAYLRTSSWYCFNDSSVTQVSADRAIFDNYGSHLGEPPKSHSAYMLMYVRVSSIPHVYRPFEVSEVPKHVSDFIKEQERLKIEEERAQWEQLQSIDLKIIDEDGLKDRINNNRLDLLGAPARDIKVLRTNTLAEVYQAISDKPVRLWYTNGPYVISPVPCSRSLKASEIRYPTLFVENAQGINFLRPNSQFVLIFVVSFSPVFPNPLNFVACITAPKEETLLNLAVHTGLKSDLVYVVAHSNLCTRVEIHSKIGEACIFDGTYVIFQTQPQKQIETHSDSTHYFEMFPEKIPKNAIDFLKVMDEMITFKIESRTITVPYTLSLDELALFTSKLMGCSYQPESETMLFYVNDSVWPIEMLDKSIEELSYAIIPIFENSEESPILRVVIQFSEDAVQVSREIVSHFASDETASSIVRLCRTELKLKKDIPLRLLKCKGKKIKEFIPDVEEIGSLTNPVRVEIIPPEQRGSKKKGFLVSVAMMKTNKEGYSEYFGTPFIFNIIPNEAVPETLNRLSDYVGFDRSEIQNSRLVTKQSVSGEKARIQRTDVLYNIMSRMDQLLIEFQDGVEIPRKNNRRNEKPSGVRFFN